MTKSCEQDNIPLKKNW